MAGLVHLVKRFFGAARPGAPKASEEQWAVATLSDAEVEIWAQMNNPDRRHAIQVARDVAREITAMSGKDESDLEPWILPAALLHDSGKIVSNFRTPARVAATVLWAIADDNTAQSWLSSPRSVQRRFAEYRYHPQLGGELLRSAGAHEYTSCWAEEHHLQRAEWSVPLEFADVLKRCDDD